MYLLTQVRKLIHTVNGPSILYGFIQISFCFSHCVEGGSPPVPGALRDLPGGHLPLLLCPKEARAHVPDNARFVLTLYQHVFFNILLDFRCQIC